jgi:hypothetical protein
MIIVYGGCQADEPGRVTPRLPSDAADEVFGRIRGLLQSLAPTCVVGALASGADILFARAALEEGIPLKVLLPFDAETFRKSSVEPAGQPWIGDYDRIITTTGKYKGTDKDRVTVADGRLEPADADVYHKHNSALLDHAAALARPGGERVWLLSVRPKPDPLSPTVTDDLMSRANERGMLALDVDPLPPSRRSAFIVMPYGKKKDPRVNRFVECNPAFHKVYRPLLEDFDVDWTRADLLTDSGLIHSAMLSDLANSDLVVADLSAINFNVAYELGIRHVFASRATVLIDPSVVSFKHGTPPFDINMIRTHTFERSPDDVTDEQAETAIDALREVMATALEPGKSDSPCHEWFDLGQIVRPFQPRAAVPQFRRAGKTVRDAVAAATRSADPDKMRAEAANVAAATDIKPVARRACQIELAAGLLNEGAYDDARKLLELAKPGPDDPPPDEDPLQRTWLHKTVMAYRRLGEQTADEAEQRKLWDVAKQYLLEAEEAGYRDSETYGIWGGLLKRQLQSQRAEMDKAVAQSLFAEMEQRYRSGFELDPDYYTGVNVVMALRWSGRPRDDAFARDFNELLTVSRFLAQVARKEDPQNFWAAVTLAELTLHEALERGTATIDDAVGQYADAARIGRPDEIASARFQLEFMRQCGDRGDVIDRALAAVPLPG